jgi:hypothetical protein
MPRAPRTPRIARRASVPTATAAALVIAAPALLSACSAGAPADPAPPPATTTTTAAPPPDPVTACVGQLTYWADQDLSGAADPGYDYQHRGLTSEQAEALTVLEERARAEGWTAEQLAEQARAACVPIAAQQTKGY